MGCDIHLYVEKKNSQGQWEILRDVKDEKELYQPYHSRNYDLFAILAGVRGYLNYIEPPKGVPDNASPEYKKMVEDWDCDGHSHSYFTVRELLDYDWTQIATHQGYIEIEVWQKWDSYGRKYGEEPDEWCGGFYSPNSTIISMENAEKLFKNANTFDERKEIASKNKKTYVASEWEIKYSKCCNEFLSETLTELLKLSNGTQHLDDVRIVFFFDN